MMQERLEVRIRDVSGWYTLLTTNRFVVCRDKPGPDNISLDDIIYRDKLTSGSPKSCEPRAFSQATRSIVNELDSVQGVYSLLHFDVRTSHSGYGAAFFCVSRT